MYREGEIYFYLKDDEHGWLSNFYPSQIDIGGLTWPTVEHYYQAQKAERLDFYLWIRDAPTPYHAMRAGRALRREKGETWDGWDNMREGVMLQALRAKFSQNPELRALLLATGNSPIHEDSPTDKFWGVLGEDKLGKLIMRVREELKAGKLK